MRCAWLLPAGGAILSAPYAQVAHAAEYLSVDAAQRKAFPEATAFEAIVVAADVKAAIAKEAGRFVVEPRIWRVQGGDRTLGWLFVDDVIGKQELITYALALDATGAVRSLEILAYRETHGDAIRLPAWRAQFTGKRGADPVRLDVDIRNVSGATLSCRHVTEGVRRLLLIHERVLAHA